LNGKCHLVRIVQFIMKENTCKNEQKCLLHNDKKTQIKFKEVDLHLRFFKDKYAIEY